MLDREAKQVIVNELSEVIAGSNAVVAATYHGTTVTQMTDLRLRARERDVFVKVVKNSLARRSFEGTDFACLQDGLKGPLILVFSRKDQADAAKVVKEFIGEHENTLEVKMVALPNQLMDASGLEQLASLPTRDEAIATLMSVMQAPIAQFVRTLAAVPSKLARTLTALKESKD